MSMVSPQPLERPPRLRDSDPERHEPAEPPEDRLRQLAAGVGPLRRALAAIAERLIATRAHEQLCFARISDYARERPGVSARQLQELARVHRAFAELPELERALVTNELPWSKVRLIARVASGGDEREWIALAQSLPTRELERKVREQHADGSEPDGIDDVLTSVRIRCTPAVSEKWCLVHEMAERVAGERLLSGEALEWVAAEVFSATSLESAFIESGDEAPARAREPVEPAAAGEYSPDPRVPSQSLPRAIASLAAQLEEACAFHHQRNVHSGLMRIWGRAPGDLVFDLPLARYRSGDVAIPRPARIFDNSSAIAARAQSASWRTASRRNVVESDVKGGVMGSR
jgi:hypothetical protein